MANEDQKHSRVVVDTPTSRDEYIRSETSYDHNTASFSGAAVAAIVVGIVAIVTILFLVMYNRQISVEANANARQASSAPSPQQPIIVEQPTVAPAPPVVVEQPAQPIMPSMPPPEQKQAASGVPAKSSVADDTALQTALDKKFHDDSVLSGFPLTAIVMDGQVTLTGSVSSIDQKIRAEKSARTVKGVKSVDNQILVTKQ